MSRSHTADRQERHSKAGWYGGPCSRRRFLATARASAGLALAPLWEALAPRARSVQWGDLAPVRGHLTPLRLTAATFPTYVRKVHDANLRRVREGDRDHLVFYALQSTHFTRDPFIEPALSAKDLVAAMTPAQRGTFLNNGRTDLSSVPPAVRARFAVLIRALDAPAPDTRLLYFRDVLNTLAPQRARREPALLREYLRVMRFVYQKEFIAQRAADAPDAVAELYRTRGLSTDTAVEAGYLVSVGLGILKGLDPDRRVRRVLIVGPGLDLAPRTGLLEAGPPESYQPWAVIDALVALGLSRVAELDVVGADINPRVVEHLRRARSAAPTLRLISGVPESETVRLSNEYRDYFERLGRAVGDEQQDARTTDAARGHLRKTVRIRPEVARTIQAEPLDVVTERLGGTLFDLVVATNILPYFDDVQLTLALGNITAMLAPGGAFLHNEPRPLVRDIAAAFDVPFDQSRQAVIASVRGAPGPLVDSVWLHRRK